MSSAIGHEAGSDPERSERRPSEQEPAPTRRERLREATISEIKQTALRLMHESGTTDVRFSDIAREMGMTAPGLYRYFGSAEDLLTAMITDAYDDLGASVAQAREAVPEERLWEQVLAIAQAYRGWARREPQQFALIFGMPVPGYCAPAEGATTEAAKRAMGQLQQTFLTAELRGELGPPLLEGCAREVAEGFDAAHNADHLMPGAWNDDDRTAVANALTPATMQSMVLFWAALHGLVSLDAYGHLDWLGDAARDGIFVAGVQQAARAAGLPDPSAVAHRDTPAKPQTNRG